MKKLFTLLALIVLGVSYAQTCEDGFRLFEHAEGTTCIPETPQRIVTIGDRDLLTPLIDIGAPVIAAPYREQEDGTLWIRGAIDIYGEAVMEELALASIGVGGIDFERVAALEPDLIFSAPWAGDNLDKLQAIAPVVVIPDWIPMLDHMAMMADAAGLAGTYETRLEEYRADLASLVELVGDPSQIVVSRFDIWEDGIWYYPNWGAIEQVIRDAGYTMPPFQTEATDSVNGLSVERIQEFDGDVILFSYAPRFGQTIPMLSEQWDTVAPFWRSLPAVETNEYFWYERDIYTGYSFASLNRSIELMALITAGRGLE
ncbi:MAG: ABC transporter substrate-binding protein [Deinococcota bacterium]